MSQTSARLGDGPVLGMIASCRAPLLRLVHRLELLTGVAEALDRVVQRGSSAVGGGRAGEHERDVDQIALQPCSRRSS